MGSINITIFSLKPEVTFVIMGLRDEVTGHRLHCHSCTRVPRELALYCEVAAEGILTSYLLESEFVLLVLGQQGFCRSVNYF